MTQENMSDLRRNILFGYAEKRKAWHYDAANADSVANHIEGPLSRELIAARLFDFTVDEKPVFIFDDSTGSFRAIEGRKAMVTSDTLETLGVFKEGYKGHDYKESLLDALEALVGEGVAFSTAGLLRNRGVGFVQLELPETFKTQEGVGFRPNLGAATSFDGTLSTTYKRGVTIWQCDNTLSIGLREDGQAYKVKHSKYSEMKLANAQEALDLLVASAEDVAKEISKLCTWEVTDSQFEAFLAKLVPVPTLEANENTRGRTLALGKSEAIRGLYDTDARANPWRGTAYGVLQATNTYNQHEANIRGTNDRDVRRFENFFAGKTEANDNATLALLAKVCEREYA